MSERQTEAGNQITLSHSLILSLSHSFTLSFTHSQHAEQLLFSCLCSKITLSLSHSHTLTLSHSLILSFNHSRHAEQVLFSCLGSKVAVYSRKLQCFLFLIACFFLTKLFIYGFFGTTSAPSPVTLPFIELVPS